MKEIEKKSIGMLGKLKSKIIEFLRDKCFRFRNFLNKHSKDMCFSKKEIEEIKERVEKTKESEVKFDEFSQVAPAIYEFIEVLKSDVDRLEKEKQFCIQGIKEIYLADIENNDDKKSQIFARFGLPFVLNN